MSHQKTYFLKNMLSNCCKILLAERLLGKGIDIVEIKLGELTVNLKNDEDEPLIESITGELGFQIIQNRDDVLVEEIKKAVIELIHDLNNVNSIVRKSDYLVEKLGMSYQQLSKTFSNHEPVTLEKYIILQKIEKIKELIDNNEYTLSEISYMMDYSSIQHLSAQFRQITGLTPSEYKKSDHSMRKAIDEVY